MISAARAVGNQARELNYEAWVSTLPAPWLIGYTVRPPNMSMYRMSLFTPSVMVDVIWFHKLMGYKERATKKQGEVFNEVI